MPKRLRSDEIISKRHLHRCAKEQTKKDLEFLKQFHYNVNNVVENGMYNTVRTITSIVKTQ